MADTLRPHGDVSVRLRRAPVLPTAEAGAYTPLPVQLGNLGVGKAGPLMGYLPPAGGGPSGSEPGHTSSLFALADWLPSGPFPRSGLPSRSASHGGVLETPFGQSILAAPTSVGGGSWYVAPGLLPRAQAVVDELLAAYRQSKELFAVRGLRHLFQYLRVELFISVDRTVDGPARVTTPGEEHADGGTYHDENSKRMWKAGRLAQHEATLIAPFQSTGDMVGFDAAVAAMAEALQKYADCKIDFLSDVLSLVEDAWMAAIDRWGSDPDAAGKSGNEDMDEMMRFNQEDKVKEIFKVTRYYGGIPVRPKGN